MYYNKRCINFISIVLEALDYSKQKLNFLVHENKCTLKTCTLYVHNLCIKEFALMMREGFLAKQKHFETSFTVLAN